MLAWRVVAASAVFVSFAHAARAAGPVDFNRDIRPILSNNCFMCHGPDAQSRKADLRLDTRQGLMDSKVVVAGKPAESELFKRLASEDRSELMPPPKSGKKLTAGQIDLLKRWIEQGAQWRGHWAYEPVARPAIAPAPAGDFVRNDIDRMILARLASAGLAPSQQADRPTLIRRLSLDLTGLPPTAEEVRAFVEDQRPDAYERLVERLLASPHFGERMAVYWLDLVRFADTIGYHSDNPRNIAPYRDYVINAFNANLPFDQFTIEQIAGDLLSDATTSQKIASAYNRLLQTTEEGGAQPKEYAAKYMSDRVRNLSSAWLGATMVCSECHDHKYDPLSMRDFYSMQAFFADVREAPVGKRERGVALANAAQQAEMRRHDEGIAAMKAAMEGAKDDPQLPEKKKQLAELEKKRIEYLDTVPHVLVSEQVSPRDIRILPRGNWLDDSGEIVGPAIPAVFGKLEIKDRKLARLQLACWLVARDNPLTARVFMNRAWKLFFGAGLSRTLDDFGMQGEPPTHPELLDYLAAEFMDKGWDVKHMIRLMVTSGTYRQSSTPSAAHKQIDPENRLLGRQGRFRLEAEFVRDNALAIAGILSPRIGGESVKPYQPEGYWEYLNFPKRTYVADTGEKQYRRGLYTHWQRTFLHPSLRAFDASTREECEATRPRSNIPQQALVLLNDPTYVEAARVLAEKIMRQGGKTAEERLAWAFERTIARKPDAREVKVLKGLLTQQSDAFAKDPKGAEALLKTGGAEPPKDISPMELAAWTSVARAILNLHETITRL